MSTMASAVGLKPCVGKTAAEQKPFVGTSPVLRQRRSPISQSRQQLPQSHCTELSRPSTRRFVKASAVQELYQVADVGSFVTGTAATMFAMTLVGLAIGFVLLRFEALVEEGKI